MHPPTPAGALAEASSAQAQPYSVFSRVEKWFIVSLIALAGLFSPLTANIYFPAIPTLSREFHKSTELLNLTVTMYIIMQGISPMIWGPLADRYGRRPVYVGCLTVLTLTNIGLALATGSASTIALGAGVIGDISTREERGGFFGLFTLGPMIGPVIGPVIGGAISEALGWRALFWFLVITTAACLVVMILLFPETLRRLVGNGSIAPPRFYRPLLPLMPRKKPTKRTAADPVQTTFQNPFHLFANIDIFLLLCLNAIVNGVMYGVITTISTTFTVAYPSLTETTIGLCFLAYGGAMIIGGLANGWILDREYQEVKKKHSSEATHPQDSFPIEVARLRLLPFMMLIFAGCVGGYGWTLQHRVSIAVPLVIQFIIGYTCISALNSTSTLMIDLFPKQGSSITACNNLVRCTFAAIVVSVIQLIINKIGLGWTFIILCCLSILTIPLIILEMVLGPRYRQARYEREAQFDALSEDADKIEAPKEQAVGISTLEGGAKAEPTHET